MAPEEAATCFPDLLQGLDCFLFKKFLSSIKFFIKVAVSLHMNTPLG